MVGVLLISTSTQGSVLYSDDFSGASGSDLQGTAPDTRPGTETWVSSSNWKADGSKSASGNGNAYLPFTPAAGLTYTLSADVNTTDGGQDWLVIGFAGSANVTSTFHSSGDTYAWMLLRDARGDNGIQSFLGGGATSVVNHTAPVGVVNLKVVLDTTTPSWSAQWFANNDLLRTTSFTTNPTISHVAFGAFNGALGTVDNFTLSVVPEPAGLSLLALGGVALLRRRHQTTVGE